MNRISYIILVFMLCKCGITYAQVLQWQQSIGSTSNDLINDVHIDANGNKYVCAHSFVEVNVNPNGTPVFLGNSQSLGIGYLIKYNSENQLQWIYSIDVVNREDDIHSVCTDSLGNVYITGFVGGFFNAATHPDSTNIIGSNYGCAFLIKLKGDGSFVWAKNFISQKTPPVWGQPPWQRFSEGLKIKNTHNELYISGAYQGITQFDPDSSMGNLNPISNNSPYNDIFVCKYTTNGDFQWVFRLASLGADAPSDLSFDNAGNLLISGLQGGALDFDPSSTTTYAPPIKGTSDCFMAKYSPQGGFIWAYVFGGTLGGDRVNGIASDEHNNVYIAGEYRDTVDFAPTSIVVNAISTGLKDAYLAKYSPNKVLQWVKSFGNANDNEVFKSLAYAEGKLYTTGSFVNELHLNNTNLQILYSNGLNDVMVAVFDTNGIAQQSFALGSKLSDEGLIIVPNNNHVFLGGYYRDSTDFALDTAFSLATCQGGYDIFIAEYNLNELVNKIKIATIENAGINLFPNPNNGNFCVEFTEQKISGVLEIYDLNGQLMHSEYVAPWSNIKNINLEHKLSNG
ncbi:MAG: T9SS type A sorting domain-containing protein, partial [Bacteroidia bacterium]|nr:T9SS type A sorting domain-containing protein [Bacteroidia bacterium]